MEAVHYVDHVSTGMGGVCRVCEATWSHAHQPWVFLHEDRQSRIHQPPLVGINRHWASLGPWHGYQSMTWHRKVTKLAINNGLSKAKAKLHAGLKCVLIFQRCISCAAGARILGAS